MKPYRPGKCAQCGQTKRLSTRLKIKGRDQGGLCDACAAMQEGLGDSTEGPAKAPLVAQEAKEGPKAGDRPPRRKRSSRIDYTKPQVIVRGEEGVPDSAAK